MQVDAKYPTTISFSLVNTISAQPSQPVNIMASGLLPIGSTKMLAAGGSNSPMLIGDLGISQSTVCESNLCNAGSYCACLGSFSDIPTGRRVYVLKAEVQCNGGGGNFNISSPAIKSVQSALSQPPASCTASCDAYSVLFSGIDVASLIVTGSLTLGANVDKVGPDLCMAGKHLKVLFTLQYSKP